MATATAVLVAGLSIGCREKSSGTGTGGTGGGGRSGQSGSAGGGTGSGAAGGSGGGAVAGTGGAGAVAGTGSGGAVAGTGGVTGAGGAIPDAGTDRPVDAPATDGPGDGPGADWAGVPACPSPDAGAGDCNNLRVRGAIIDPVVNADASSWPVPTGGAIEDGEYDLVAAESTSAQGFRRGHTMRVVGPRRIEWVIRLDSSSAIYTYSTDVVIAGDTVSFVLTCGQDQVVHAPSYRFSAAGNEVRFYSRDEPTMTQQVSTYRRRCR
jgi:hypothetical protein